jgi:hypothetical protein
MCSFFSHAFYGNKWIGGGSTYAPNSLRLQVVVHPQLMYYITYITIRTQQIKAVDSPIYTQWQLLSQLMSLTWSQQTEWRFRAYNKPVV